MTLLLGWLALGMKVNGSYAKTLPIRHPFIANYLENQAHLAGQAQVLRIAVALAPPDAAAPAVRSAGSVERTILDKDYLDALRRLGDEISLLPGVDSPFMKSLWTSNMRWFAAGEEGLDGGTVISDRYDGSPGAMAELRGRIERSGEVGRMVAADFKSTIIHVPVLDKDPRTGAALDYGALNQRIEALRERFQAAGLRIHVIGFAKVTGDLIASMPLMLGFIALACFISAAVLYGCTRSLRSTMCVVICSLAAVVWQFGLLRLLRIELDPRAIVVPFVVFAIGMSHGAQIMNGVLQDVGRGIHCVVAVRLTFRRLFAAGLAALLCNALGFAVLAFVEIRLIQDLALAACVGVAALVLTNLVLLPVLLSHVGVSVKAARRSVPRDWRQPTKGLWALLYGVTRPRRALAAIGVAGLLAVAGFMASQQLRLGDSAPGASELRVDSRYNRDSAYIEQHYAGSTDILTVMVKTREDQCSSYETLSLVDDLAW
ncbi:MAG TPA: MMPL family transporter, partial [Burkholderiaceae bacterium]|nr:MMPL family transporter [Burkholderiaceae bacterium]